MSKRLMLVGPKDSGKTCFAYLLKMKLFDIIHNPKCREDYIHRGYESEVMDKIEANLWADPTDTKKKANLLYMECIYPWKFGLSKKAFINMPDISANLYHKMLEADRQRRNHSRLKVTNANISQSNPEEETTNEDVTIRIKNSNAFIFFVDTTVVNATPSDQTNDNFYHEFVNFIRNNLTRKTKRLKKPVLVLLNKSDSLYTTEDEMYGRENDAREYLAQHATNFLALLYDTFDRKYLSFAFHSPVGRVRHLTHEERYAPSLPIAPDYAFFKTIDAETYTKSFRDFLRKL